MYKSQPQLWIYDLFVKFFWWHSLLHASEMVFLINFLSLQEKTFPVFFIHKFSFAWVSRRLQRQDWNLFVWMFSNFCFGGCFIARTDLSPFIADSDLERISPPSILLLPFIWPRQLFFLKPHSSSQVVRLQKPTGGISWKESFIDDQHICWIL